MKREEFFGFLKKRLQMIEQNELDDILEEYRQHIDMKIQSGVSEEEAIKDFGDVNTLADEILESYHIRLDYDNDSEEKEKKNYLKIFWESVKKVYISFLGVLSGAYLSIDRFFRALFARLVMFFKKDKKREASEEQKLSEQIKAKENKKERFSKKEALEKKSKKICEGTGKKIMLIFSKLKEFFLWTIKAIINIFIICTGSITGFFAAIALFFLGFLIIMLATGYPVWGMTITTLGLTLTFSSLTLLIFSFMQLKKKAVLNKALPENTLKEQPSQQESEQKEENKDEH